jgi:hypothetical protein
MRSGTCKHYNGSFHNDKCAIGIAYRDVTNKPDEPGCAYRKPCVKLDPLDPGDAHGLKVIADTGPQGVCEKYEEPSQDEIAAHEKVMNEAMDRMMRTMPLCIAIKEEHAGHDWQGVKECPICGGDLHLTHAAYNGHVHGKCETENCVSWME